MTAGNSPGGGLNFTGRQCYTTLLSGFLRKGLQVAVILGVFPLSTKPVENFVDFLPRAGVKGACFLAFFPVGESLTTLK